MYKKLLSVGPGGIKCSCCFPAPGSAARRFSFRRIRRVLANTLRAEVAEALEPEEALDLIALEDSYWNTYSRRDYYG